MRAAYPGFGAIVPNSHRELRRGMVFHNLQEWAISVAGCNTFKGTGKDIQRGGEAVENAADNAHSRNSNYKTPRHSIESYSGSGGYINPEGKATFASGASSTYTVRANPGYHIADVVVDGKSMGAVQRHTFEKLSQNHKISAKFTSDSKSELQP